MNRDKNLERDENRDPISGTPGAHPVGTGLGATGGAVAGAAIGAMGGPIGAGIGIAAGAIAGGLAGKAAAEKVDPTVEDQYWREAYSSRPYVEEGDTYETHEPAYRVGYENYGRYEGQSFEEVEDDLRQDYEQRVGQGGIAWDRARHATRDSWQRIESADTMEPGENRSYREATIPIETADDAYDANESSGSLSQGGGARRGDYAMHDVERDAGAYQTDDPDQIQGAAQRNADQPYDVDGNPLSGVETDEESSQGGRHDRF